MNILRLRMVWERLAQEDPYWAVLTAPDKSGNRWKIEEFFQTGVDEVRRSLEETETLAPGAPRGTAIDFGCGVGRLSQGLARYYDTVVGVDVARRMIELANQHNRAPDQITYIHNPNSDLRRFADQSFDLTFSLITLQHIPPKLIESYLREFVRITRPDGLIYFQLPTYAAKPSTEIKRWSWYPPTAFKRLCRWSGHWFRKFTGIGDKMSMHTLSADRVRTVLENAGGQLIHQRPHDMQSDFRSMIYIARPSPPERLDHP